MSTTTAAERVDAERGGDGGGLGRLVDWVVTGLLALWGLGLAAGGYVAFGLADRADIARWIAAGRITSTELTDAQLLDATYALLWWGGVGLAGTGLLFVVTAVAFLSVRSRSRRSGARPGGLAASAVLGAVTTAATSFLPFAAAIGGAAAAYDRGGSRETGLVTGAASGLLGAVPVALVFGVVALGLLSVDATAGGVALVALAVALLTVATTYGLLGAVGGYVGAGLRRQTPPGDADAEPPVA
jgi:hypothetical protein